MTNQNESLAPARDLVGGVALALGAVLAVAFMLHHPHGAHGSDAREMLADVARRAGVIRGVHAALLGALFALTFGHASLAQALGLHRPLARLGLLAYVAGAACQGLAGVLNGLVFPALAARHADSAAPLAETVQVVTHFSFELNQALAAVGVVAVSLAITAWSSALLRARGAWRIVGALGLAIGVGAAGLVLAGRIDMDVDGFGALVVATSAWAFVAGLRLAWSVG